MNPEERKQQQRQEARDAWLGAIIDRHLEGIAEAEGHLLTKVSHINRGGEWLTVIVADNVDGPSEVAFVSSETIGGSLRILASKLQQGTLKWKENRPYGG